MNDDVGVRERPILFSGPMVRALIEGRKTQTRRVMKPQPGEDCGQILVGRYHPTGCDRNGEMYPGDIVFGAYTYDGEQGWRCPYGEPGDRLWVRETWTIKNWTNAQCRGVGFPAAPQHPTEVYLDVPTRAIHRASWDTGYDIYGPQTWKPSIHMPRWASRITLEVTEVRVERLQEITEADAIAEGVTTGSFVSPDDAPRTHVEAFKWTWNKLNAKRGYGWDDNPWVWRIGFKPLPSPSEALPSHEELGGGAR